MSWVSDGVLIEYLALGTLGTHRGYLGTLGNLWVAERRSNNELQGEDGRARKKEERIENEWR